MIRKLFLSFIITIFCTLVFAQNQVSYKMIVGTYTRETPSKGIYLLKFDTRGNFLSQKLLAESDNPSFLAFSPDKKYVYAVNETGKESMISAFAFNTEKETLTFINKVSAAGEDPCYVSCTENHVIIANYSSGSVSVFERKNDGSLTEAVQLITLPRKLFGRGLKGPSNAHQVMFSPDGKHLIITNLGTDRVFTFNYIPTNKEPLTYVDEIGVKAHSGPRHTVFSKNGKFLYLVRELDAGITVFSVKNDSRLNIIQETTLVTDSTKKNGAADIHLSPDGKFLYATNRIETNNITCFKVNKNGTLKFVEQVSTHGINPRNFAISPDGKFIFTGNQKTNNITVFSRNFSTGKLKLLTDKVALGSPVCLLFY